MPGSGGRRWDYYTVGHSVGAVTIRARLNDAEVADDVLYDVTWDCCGRPDDMTHAQITRGKRKGRVRCSACARIANGKKTGSENGKKRPKKQKRPAAKGTVTIESGAWRGTYAPLGPMGPRWERS